MSELYVTTIGNVLARRNFALTVLKPESPHFWGLRAGPQNIARWSRVVPDDRILFKMDGRFCAVCSVDSTVRDQRLAEQLWGHGAGGETWELLFVLKPPELLNVPAREYAIYLGQRHAGFVRIPKSYIDRANQHFGKRAFTSLLALDNF